MAATVTIDKIYFETLLRRAEFHISGKDLATPLNLPTVTIPKVDHDNLWFQLRMAREYTSLRDALYRGGIAEETLEVRVTFTEHMNRADGIGKVLIQGDTTIQPQKVQWADNDEDYNGGVAISRPERKAANLSIPTGNGTDQHSHFQWPSRNTSGNGNMRDLSALHTHRPSYGQDDTSFPSEPDRDDHGLPEPRNEKQQYARAEQRTLVLKNLSERTTHKDIVDIVRGGALLDIYLRSNERNASVSFVEGTAAQNFMNYAKRNDIYIHGKRVEFAWNDRQFILPGHVANKIGIGATRNLIVRNAHPNITAERIREDLDHIHNLIVIDISFQNGNAHISLNSVHNSLFSRTCMMSRGVYKGMRIEWYADECAQPLPKMQHAPKKENVAAPAKRPSTTVNRFHMLNLDGTEDGSEEEDEKPLDGYTPMNSNLTWAPTVAA